MMSIDMLPQTWPDEIFQAVVAKYRDFRPQSLKLAPDAYASTYEQEVECKPEVWRRRLTNPQAQHVMLSRNNPKTEPSGIESVRAMSVGEEERLMEREWLGMIVVVERATASKSIERKSPWEFNQAIAVGEGDLSRTLQGDYSYQLNGLFVCPSIRRQGLGEALVQSGIEGAKATAKQRGLSHANLSIMLEVGNKAARALYDRNAFIDSGEEEFTVGGSSRRALTMVCTVACE